METICLPFFVVFDKEIAKRLQQQESESRDLDDDDEVWSMGVWKNENTQLDVKVYVCMWGLDWLLTQVYGFEVTQLDCSCSLWHPAGLL